MSSNKSCQSFEEKGDKKYWDYDDIADCIISVSWKASFHKFIVVERVKEVETLLEYECKNTESKVFRWSIQKSTIMGQYFTQTITSTGTFTL